jgi:hypothetical protein
MNPDSENFDLLRKLLRLKRYEQPPPGYFNRFSSQVMARIEAGESGDQVGLDYSWWQRFLSMFDVKPVFAGAFGMAVCALLVSGIVSSEHAAANSPVMASSPSGVSVPAGGQVADVMPYDAGSSTNPLVQNSLFNQFGDVQARQVSDTILIPVHN